MRIAIINETSAADKNRAIVSALESTKHEIFNVGMKEKGKAPELQYVHTGLMGALLLNTGRVDFVVGGCGTGQGFLTSVMQYPGVFCGHILTPLDAWLFTQINGGNCISLALNQGYGWASDINLEFIFDRLFSVESGGGYPAERKVPQAKSRKMLIEISQTTHRSMADIVSSLPDDIVQPALRYPGFLECLSPDSFDDNALRQAVNDRR